MSNKSTIYTDSEVTINGVTYRNLPAQVRRNQDLSEQASEDATGAAQGIAEAKAAAAQALTAAQNAQTTADNAQTAATNAGNLANTALEQGQTAETLARGAQDEAASASDLAVEAVNASSHAVRYDIAQTLTDEQKAQARDNIGAGTGGGGGGAENAVLYVAQTLTDDQKAQARTNIGAGKNNYSPTTPTPTTSKFMEQTLDDYTVASYFFDVGSAIQTGRYDTHFIVLHNNTELASGEGSVKLGVSWYKAGTSATPYTEILTLPVSSGVKTIAIGFVKNRDYRLLIPVTSASVQLKSCVICPILSSITFTESTSTSNATATSFVKYDSSFDSYTNVKLRITQSGINDDTKMTWFGGLYNNVG